MLKGREEEGVLGGGVGYPSESSATVVIRLFTR